MVAVSVSSTLTMSRVLVLDVSISGFSTVRGPLWQAAKAQMAKADTAILPFMFMFMIPNIIKIWVALCIFANLWVLVKTCVLRA